jgi:phosphatidylethanolamine/phosphatidyl-N-methylethanolamine N-methyltransferase
MAESIKLDDATHLDFDREMVEQAYDRWAPIYDLVFGGVFSKGRTAAIQATNKLGGRVLEVGVGTGLALPDYKEHLDIVGIDLAPEMLEKARERVKAEQLTNISGLYEMDASNLRFQDNTFDTTVAMYVITVVPDPQKVMLELARVTKPGGEVMLVNHFSQEEGVRGWVERQMAPFADLVGWHSVFDVSRVMVCSDLKLMDRKALRPWGIFTMMRFRKDEGAVSQHPVAAE